MPNEMITSCLSNNKNLGDRYSSHMTHSSVHGESMKQLLYVNWKSTNMT